MKAIVLDKPLWLEKEIKSVANVTREDAAVLNTGNFQNEPKTLEFSR